MENMQTPHTEGWGGNSKPGVQATTLSRAPLCHPTCPYVTWHETHGPSTGGLELEDQEKIDKLEKDQLYY